MRERELVEATPQGITEPLAALAIEQEEETPVAPISGMLRLTEMLVNAPGMGDSQRLVQSDRPFKILVTLDLSDLNVPRDILFDYSAIIYAKKLGVYSRQMVGSAKGSLMPIDQVNVEVKDIKLSNGVYRIEAFVELKPPLQPAKPIAGLRAMSESSLIQVF
jgi:hypothetical protein